ncbi:hypothetical protein [Haloarcula litorea]|uniref:hypothetical protein n=1 Tax=Haloarcula litorea TaxID=3032579 RepID=UPI0023E7DA83|nr:hypothetical protein [Halomicroarcula sp. GDY20]
MSGDGEDGPETESAASPAADRPVVCPVCGADFESVSVHDEGVMVNLLDNEVFRRVCFQPAGEGGTPVVRFFHHTHEQAGTDDPGTPGGRVP